MKKLPVSFYRQPDVVKIAKGLLGKCLFSNIGDKLCGGIIAETEAYAGVVDRASHAYGGRRTARTETMYQPGGISYVYFTYGMHHLFNVITATKDTPHAVLIRGIIPTEGIGIQRTRRKMPSGRKQLTNGPAKVCQALGITLEQNGISLLGNILWLSDDGFIPVENRIVATARVGVDYAGEDALLPYRFILKYPDYLPVMNGRKKA
ncbi:MAG: putative 3-methyladenine DNA glycosylase [bacterium]|nr:MAG: putative 3-methyladenine DNA glycosylase [bacterium]